MESTLIDKHMNALYAKKSGAGSRKPHVAGPIERPIIITCMSPWVVPTDIFDLKEGEAYIIRCAGNIVTQETIRCILLAMMVDRVSDIIVLGHTGCSNTDKEKVFRNLDKFYARLPQRSYYRETLGSREKALKFFGIYEDEIENIRAQIESLAFLRTIQANINITGMLYNHQNGHVYTLKELEQLHRLRAQDPAKDFSDMVPTRYTAYVKAREDVSSQVPMIPGGNDEDNIPSTPPSLDDEPDRKAAENVPKEFAGQQLAFEKLMEAMQKSITKVSKVRIFTPKFRVPHIKGIETSAAQKAPSS
jgi:carbonic anhydrase